MGKTHNTAEVCALARLNTADTVSGLGQEKSLITTSDKRAGKVCAEVTRREGQAEIGAAVVLRILRVSQMGGNFALEIIATCSLSVARLGYLSHWSFRRLWCDS